MSDNIVQISDSSFDSDVLQAEGPVLVDFWAEWCGPCKMIAPVLEELASEYGEKLKICKMDVDANPETAPKYGRSKQGIFRMNVLAYRVLLRKNPIGLPLS